jgi:hypothetical protein
MDLFVKCGFFVMGRKEREPHLLGLIKTHAVLLFLDDNVLSRTKKRFMMQRQRNCLSRLHNDDFMVTKRTN